MPTYDYLCDQCGHEFEAFESITAEPQRDCPACGTPRLRRKIGAGAAILFKGSGFYQTDYRSASYQKAAKAEASSNGSGTGTSGDAKPSSTGSGGSTGASTSAPTSASPGSRSAG